MNILQVTEFLSPVHGGSSVVPYQLSRELSRREHQITICTSDFKLSRDYMNPIPAVTIRPFKTWLGLAKFYVTPGIIRYARDEAKHTDIIHMHNYRTFQNVVLHHYAKKYGIPYVLQTHGSTATYFQRGTLKKLFDRIWGYKILKDASRLIALTTLETEQYRGMGISEQKIEIVPNGIDLDEFNSLPPKGNFRLKHGLSQDRKIVLYLARINKIKGPDLLARAFTELVKEIDNVTLVIAGPDEGYLSPLKKMVKQLGIEETVIFPGPLYGRDKLEAYVDGDVYVLPSVYETFPISLLEVLACGTPVIVTNRCGLADTVAGQAGLVVPFDEGQLKQALLHILNDDKMREGVGESGKLLVRKNFGWAKVADQIEGVYREVIQSPVLYSAKQHPEAFC